MKTITQLTFALLAITFVFTGCKKGNDGMNGKDGNANVNVDVFELKSADWKWNSFYSFSTSPSSYTQYFTRFYDITLPSLTEEFITGEGIVLVYMQNSAMANALSYVPLPFVINNDSPKYDHNYRYEMLKGKIRLHFFFTSSISGVTIPTLSSFNIPTIKFKVVLLTGNLKTGMTSAKIDVTNIEAVNNYLESVPH